MFGSHVSFHQDLFTTLQHAQSNGMTAVQVFLGSPYSLTRRSLTSTDLHNVNEFLPNLPIFSHLPYVHNLAGSAKNKSLAYIGNQDVDQQVQNCINSIQHELNQLSPLKCTCKGCVLHIGSIGTLKDRKAGCIAVAQSINKLNFTQTSPPLLLETMVGKGGVLGSSFEELALVYGSLLESQRNHVGFCLDTCHLYSQGLYDLSKEQDVVKMFEDYDRVLPRSKLQLIHLNDSKDPFNSIKDHHEDIGKGTIWSTDQRALKLLLQHAKARSIPTVLETSEDNFKDLFTLSRQL